MIKRAGWLITFCGVAHTLGALARTVPRYADGWLGWTLREEQNRDLVEMSHTRTRSSGRPRRATRPAADRPRSKPIPLSDGYQRGAASNAA